MANNLIMKFAQRLRWTIIIASAFALVQAIGETVSLIVQAIGESADRPPFHQPLDSHYWHSLLSFERLMVEIPLCLLFGWNYPAMMRRAADRKARAAARDEMSVQPDLHRMTGVSMTRWLENSDRTSSSVFGPTAHAIDQN